MKEKNIGVAVERASRLVVDITTLANENDNTEAKNSSQILRCTACMSNQE
jgi:cytochrome c-type biogenesis protein CcmH/NrfF